MILRAQFFLYEFLFECFVRLVGFGDLSCSKFYLVYCVIYRKISKLDVFLLQNPMLHFEICESSGSKYVMKNGHLSCATAASNVLLKLHGQSGLEHYFKSLERDLSFQTIFIVFCFNIVASNTQSSLHLSSSEVNDWARL